MVDLFILDNELMITKHLNLYAQAHNLDTIVFNSGVAGLRYLQSCPEEKLPKAYLVDMRIPGKNEESKSSVDIYNFLKQKNKDNHFYFMINYISEQVQEVLTQTNAKMVIKIKPEELFNIIENLNP